MTHLSQASTGEAAIKAGNPFAKEFSENNNTMRLILIPLLLASVGGLIFGFLSVMALLSGNPADSIEIRKAEYGDPAAGRKLLFVLDKESGQLLREFEMDGYSAGAPMTYTHGGKQYIAIAVGGNQEAEIVALGL